MNLKYLLAIIVTAFMLFSCDSTSFVRGEHKVRAAVDSFAFYYFNWQFSKASRFVTDSSQVWLRYAASQVHEADVKILRDKEDATIEIEEIDVTSNDEATARITVRDFLRMDTIGTEGHLVKKASYILRLEEATEDKVRWKVRMEGLPQSERRNRD